MFLVFPRAKKSRNAVRRARIDYLRNPKADVRPAGQQQQRNKISVESRVTTVHPAEILLR